MDDRNNKNYDDFFKAQSGENEQSDTKTNYTDNSEAQGEQHENTDQEEKTSYYYSYGPTMNNRQQQPVKMYEGEYRAVEEQDERENDTQSDGSQASAVPPQLQYKQNQSRQGAVNGSWKVVKEPRRRSISSIFISFLAGALVVGGLMYTADVKNWFTPQTKVVYEGAMGGDIKNTGASGSEQPGTGNASYGLEGRPNNIADLFKKASPAVVKIETYNKQQQRQGGSGRSLLDDPFFRQFFGDYYGDNNSESQGQTEKESPSQMVQTGIGSGFIFEEEGYILTNQHVIGDADQILVTVQGYEEPIEAELLGASFDLDLAVIKLKSDKKFPTLPIGSSDDVQIGDWVVAIGNPYGFDMTTTVGVISAKERPIDIRGTGNEGDRHYKHLLQTDASINPGNSGGPLLNTAGEVIGINTAVSAQAQGIGFAIPTSTVKETVEYLKKNEAIPSPFIGVDLQTVNESIAKQLGLEKAEGSVVMNVYYKTPAYNAGLKQYDVIVGMDGINYADNTQLINTIAEKEIGSNVEFSIIRNGEPIKVTVEIGDKKTFQAN